MKKVIIATFAVFIVCGLFYVGYLIFGSLNVKEIEIMGQMQQIYFVGDDINFADAKLKVTYQNGNIKILDLKDNVKVSLFSTSGHGKYYGTMKIAYKSQTTEVDYSVIERTSYIISSEVKKTSSQTITLSNSMQRIIEFQKDGKCRYFEIINGKYYMHDGNYDSSYNYEIVGDLILVKLNDKNYEIKTSINGNELDIKAVSKYYSQTNPEIPNYIIETTFKTANLIKTNNTNEKKTNLSLDYSKIKFSIESSGLSDIILKIPNDKTIDDSGLCLKVDYDNGEIYYVYVTKNMLNGNINKNYTNQSFNIEGYYQSRKFIIIYKIV